MDATGPSVYREAAARCRKAALSSTDSKEWIVMAEQWEWLADTANGSWLLPSEDHHADMRLLDSKRLRLGEPLSAKL
jgi:hypothetical protein